MHTDTSHNLSCKYCEVKLTSTQELTNHTEKHHKDSIIESEANIVIESIKNKFKKFQVNEEIDESVNLKRSSSTSPTGTKAKKITKVCNDIETPKSLEIKLLEMEEYMKLVKKRMSRCKS